ncbi:MAG TPA: glycosyltransferase family 39 protein [Candidatus Paceibacterota bacterium]|nr:glycosyltransferase family 39 protein [Candidatus Paceibacterota bacterium]
MQNFLTKLAARPAPAIFACSLLLFCSGTWILPLTDRDEPRFAEASREMLQRGDYIVPHFNGDYRFDKPPLIYWAQMACYKLLGENAFAARLPSALFAAGTSLLIFFWTRRLAKPQTALAAAIIFATSLQMLANAHLATADMPMIFFTAVAAWSGWELTRPAAARKWWWIFHVSLALGFLAKGPVAWLPIGGLLLGKWLRPKEFNFSLPRFAAGMILTLGIVAIWGIPALILTHGEFFTVGIGHHVIFRSFGVMDGHGGKNWIKYVLLLPYFFVTFFFSFFPWAFRVPKAIWNWWPSRGTDTFGWYLFVQAALVFLTFTLVRTKLPHYTLPAFPFIAIWLARAVPGLKIWKWASAMAIFILLLTIAGFLAVKPEFASRRLFEKAKPYLQPEMKFAAVEYTEPSLVWEFRGIITNDMQTLDANQAVNFSREKHPSVLIVPTDFYKTNLLIFGTNIATVQASGFNVAKGVKVDLTAIIRR